MSEQPRRDYSSALAMLILIQAAQVVILLVILGKL